MPVLPSARRPLVALLALGALGGGTLAAVEAVTAGAATGKTQHIKLRAKAKDIAFNKSRLNARAGKVQIVFTNPRGSIAPHAVEIEGHGIEKESRTITGGKTARVSATLRKGTYEFYCPVGNHRAQGMEGTIVVK